MRIYILGGFLSMSINKTDFLLGLKLQRGIGYVKLLRIAKELDVDKVNQAWIDRVDLPQELKSAIIKACCDEKTAKMCQQIKQQCRVISFFDDEYPECLRQIYRPPLILFARGNIELLKKDIITIVGSRLATHYSQKVIEKLVPNIVASGKVIASGLAKGVDTMAHIATLENDGATIAVVGNGLNHYYPVQNQLLQKRIEKQGLILSEYLPDTIAKPYRFPERNRILAGISQGVVVTEAKAKSGSLITANLALQENRDVYAIPGPITSALSEGPNRLIESGAIPVVDYRLDEKETFDKEDKNTLFSS